MPKHLKIPVSSKPPCEGPHSLRPQFVAAIMPEASRSGKARGGAGGRLVFAAGIFRKAEWSLAMWARRLPILYTSVREACQLVPECVTMS
jgi:hypothetical protein